ncbi:MAG: transcription-repair coupling factor [Candidatus Omnitrophota bacterium]
MFRSLKLYSGLKIDLDGLAAILCDFGYHRQKTVVEERDFAVRGAVVDVFPAGFEYPVRLELDLDQVRSIYSFDLTSGKNIWQHQIVIILPNKKPAAKAFLEFNEEFPLSNFLELEKGDYVVHNRYGIGRFLGEENAKVREEVKKHLVVEYAGGDRLFVPYQDSHLIQKYIGFEFKRPKLFRLGSKEWLRIKERARKGAYKLAGELLQTQALRYSLTGFTFSADSEWQGEFEKSFPFKETQDQLRATAEVKRDMEANYPMDRLLCGDVGYGKTEVAMRAAFKAVMDNKQVAILVPTTILAEQHHYNFSQRLKDFPVKVEMLSRFKSQGEQQKIIKGLADGTVDIAIGTHRLLSADIKFKDLGLVIIDEEQRFGVKHKERLKGLRLLVDVLTLTATPIPRTLYMSMMGCRDLSVINTPPEDRLAVSTQVTQYDEDLIRQAINRELDRKGQIFFVHNHVEDIEKIARILIRLFPTVRLAIAHGQMHPSELEAVMLKFLQSEIDILVSTTIVASGIDVPNANTLIVNNADQFGLSDLHQLRGRVGRFTQKAYAYFLIPKGKPLSHDAQRRIKAIEQYSELGAGFKIAYEDLQIRGAGNLLGQEQHGYIAAVGFDLYCRLLKESVGKIKLAGKMRKLYG